MIKNKIFTFIALITTLSIVSLPSVAFSKTATYAALEGGKIVIYKRSFNGSDFGPEKVVGTFNKGSNSAIPRGWSWHNGNTASYGVYKNGKTVLTIQKFDGNDWGSSSETKISSSDDIRGWSWNGNKVSYAATKNGGTVLYIRSFDGTNFGPEREVEISSNRDDIRGWSWDGSTASYAAIKNGGTVLYIRSFDGTNFGSVKEIKISSNDDIYGWDWN